MMIKRILLIAALILLGQIGMAQVVNPVKWSFSKKQLSDTQAELQFKAVIEKGWHLYSDKLPEGGPIATSVSYDDTTLFKRIGSLTPSKPPIKVFDKTFNMELEYFGDEVTFIQKIVFEAPVSISGHIEYMSCNDETCTPPTEADFSFQFVENNDNKSEVVPVIENGKPASGTENRGLMLF